MNPGAIDQLAALYSQAELRRQERMNADLHVSVGTGTCGYAAGAAATLTAIRGELQRRGLKAVVSQMGCAGLSSFEPLVDLQARDRPRISYGHVVAQAVPEVFAAYLEGAPLRRAVVVGEARDTIMQAKGAELRARSLVDPEDGAVIPFFRKQCRILLSNCGLIDPESLDDYIAMGGYAALATALTDMAPEAVIQEITASGLRGRGGAGFPVGRKWSFARTTPNWPKYVICNADEGDPGAFMDGAILEGDPHALIEGMILAAYAIGAEHGYIYCRAEYPLAFRRLQIALRQARALGLLGGSVLGSDFGFDITVREGAGSYVAGEETALMASLEGERAEPQTRPPYPAVEGLWSQPSNVNNVKSYAYVPRIIRLGASWFRSLGTERNPGTAVYALTGMVNRTGLVEVPMGTTLREIIYELGGGIPGGRRLKAVQIGGPLGGCLTEAHLDIPADPESLRAAGSEWSGGIIVVDETTCIVAFAKHLAQFVRDESCGKCPPCRIGSLRMYEVLERITQGCGTPDDLGEIPRIASGMRATSLCAMGQLAADPIMATLRHFEDEYRAHVDTRSCPAGQCSDLLPVSDRGRSR
jgi:NADH:ubiquinone oxidoreductase subunit F (NADH-binding)